MGMKIKFEIQKIDQIIPAFGIFLENSIKQYTRVYFFFAYFLKRWQKIFESSEEEEKEEEEDEEEEKYKKSIF